MILIICDNTNTIQIYTVQLVPVSRGSVPRTHAAESTNDAVVYHGPFLVLHTHAHTLYVDTAIACRRYIKGTAIKFDELPPGLRYTLSSTNCSYFPQTPDKPNEVMTKQLLRSMQHVLRPDTLASSKKKLRKSIVTVRCHMSSPRGSGYDYTLHPPF